MANLNRIELIGNLTREPQAGETLSGKKYARLDMAINSRNENGEEVTTFINNIVCWGKTAEIAERYLHRGSLVFLEGRLTQEQWEDKQTGRTMTRYRVVAHNLQFIHLGAGKQQNQSAPAPAPRQQQQRQQRQPQPPPPPMEEEDDIPF